MSADPDGDSEMLSSPSSSEISNPQTPTLGKGTINQMANAATTELSPPGSQSRPTNEATLTGHGEEGSEPRTATTTSFDPSGTREQSNDETSSILRGEPGAAWKSKKAEDDYKRAMEYVVDRDFNLDQFGDPFDERDMDLNLT